MLEMLSVNEGRGGGRHRCPLRDAMLEGHEGAWHVGKNVSSGRGAGVRTACLGEGEAGGRCFGE